VVLKYQTHFYAIYAVVSLLKCCELRLFQNGYLAFRSLASSDLYLKLKSSVMSASFQSWPDDL
jgi:hypothetical protein